MNFSKIKRTKIRRKSSRQKEIDKCYALLRKILILKRGSQCEICHRRQTGRNLTLFHILPRGKYPKIQFSEENILLACWFPCHNDWHHDYYKARVIAKRIQELRGKDYEQVLKIKDVGAPKLGEFQIICWKSLLEVEHKKSFIEYASDNLK